MREFVSQGSRAHKTMREIFAEGSAASEDIYRYFERAAQCSAEIYPLFLIAVFFYDICFEYVAFLNVGELLKGDTALITLSDLLNVVLEALK